MYLVDGENTVYNTQYRDRVHRISHMNHWEASINTMRKNFELPFAVNPSAPGYRGLTPGSPE